MDWVEQNEKMASVELSRVFLIKIFIRLTQRTEENEKKKSTSFLERPEIFEIYDYALNSPIFSGF